MTARRRFARCAWLARQPDGWGLGLVLLALWVCLISGGQADRAAAGMPDCHPMAQGASASSTHTPKPISGHASLSAPCCQLWLLPEALSTLPMLVLTLSHPPVPRRLAFRSRSEPPLGKPPRFSSSLTG
ncbi:hypothetical protein BXU06_10830 [Aquaspirillum sp. LM1]|uniref:hypothetical protein n=1 Tax=Aquaspirillum sp. LM1 TaxID=1938604 RepID=UPI000983F808|nr:hypothetical protein [Aquaspirillum sp. LM1]AQR65490.1 hypothetical protein BXU06_10830 [Aquaspirillum sp. LM1]